MRWELGIAFIFVLALSACSTKSSVEGFSEDAPKTFFVTKMNPLPLLAHTEQYLEWTKGYSIHIRDHARGLLVTDWAFNTPLERHQVTVRVNPDVQGSSMLSAHTSFQKFDEGRWIELPSNNSYDADLIAQIQDHLDAVQTSP